MGPPDGRKGRGDKADVGSSVVTLKSSKAKVTGTKRGPGSFKVNSTFKRKGRWKL